MKSQHLLTQKKVFSTCKKSQSLNQSYLNNHISSNPRIQKRRITKYPICKSQQTTEVSAPTLSSPTAQIDGTKEQEGYFWDWKYDTRINYIHKGTESNGPAILMIHGFGVGSFHFNRNIHALGEKGFAVWAVDLVGQGKSLPENKEIKDLSLSIDSWTEQLRDFIEQVVKRPVYVVGNSLGGYLAVCLSAMHPELCKGVILLNATPFWGFGPNPETDKFMSRLIPYNGSLPVPKVLSWLVKTLWFRFLKQKSNVKNVLGLVYSDASSVDDDLIDQIVESSNHEMAVDSFTSIIFSPRTKLSFDQMLQMIKSPVCMLYGRDDPWVVPLQGQRLKRILPQAEYYELTPCGHCPHHETPNSVNFVVQEWVEGIEKGEGHLLELGEEIQVEEDRGRKINIRHIEGAPRNIFEKYDNRIYQLFNQQVKQNRGDEN